MLRFRSPPAAENLGARARHGTAPRQRWRLWMLLVALGVVIATMRQLNKPMTARRLEQLFGAAVADRHQQPSQQFVTTSASTSQQPSRIAEANKAVSNSTSHEITASGNANTGAKSGTHVKHRPADALAQVQDNTYFRPAETAAWFDLFGRLRSLDAQQLSELTLGELTYAQLLKQPHVYRGQIVTIRGTVRRQEIEHPAENSLGIVAYHRLVIQPRGGGYWPLVVYCLDLPSEFPRGDNLEATVAVTGFFFKNWSYAWRDGLGLAPVVLARSIDWQPVVVEQPRNSVTRQGLTLSLIAAGGFALLVVLWVVRSTRRSPRPSPRTQPAICLDQFVVETVDEQLQRLAEAEADK